MSARAKRPTPRPSSVPPLSHVAASALRRIADGAESIIAWREYPHPFHFAIRRCGEVAGGTPCTLVDAFAATDPSPLGAMRTE